MTEPTDNPDNTATRPISVAELLARNGSIGAPAPGGRRRRRRGNADAVTVAELTGEIPIITEPVLDDEPEPSPAAQAPTVDEEPVVEEPEPEAVETPAEAVDVAGDDVAGEDVSGEDVAAETADAAEAELAEADVAEADVADTGVADTEADPDTDTASADAASEDYDTHLMQRAADPEPVPFQLRRRTPGARAADTRAAVAEEMSPDPLLDEAEADRPSYLKSTPLFGGDQVAEEATRRTRIPGPEDIDLDARDLDVEDPDVKDPDATDLLELERDISTADTEVHYLDDADTAAGSPFLRGLWVVVQSVLAVALGAGLFIAFDQLWKWNNIVALALSVLVILGLVVGVRVVRKTEDIASTLIAVAVGAMVTLGPLALLQST